MRSLPDNLGLTKHAWKRLCGRGVSRASITAALRWGRRTWSHGELHYFLGKRAVKAARRQGVRVDAHEGTTVILSLDDQIVTVYRNRQPKRRRR
ncbi:MAG: hypothetical protein H6741_21005 [Alphaproteobacteria bacterium]|nr:hypothetical protein [Alphaproteobacteria bacterium]